MPQFPSLHKGHDVLGQPFIQGGWGGVCSPWHPPPTTLPYLAAAGRGGGEHFPGVIRGGAVKPPQPALPHRPTVPRPRRPGERDGEKSTVPPWLFPPPSSTPSSSSDNGSTGKMAQPGWPPQPPTQGGWGVEGGHLPRFPILPSAGFWGSPAGKGGPWQRAGAGTPCLCCPPPRQ